MKQKKCKIDYVFSSECPAPWSTTPDANCLCCEYLNGITRKGLYISVECSYLEVIPKMYSVK